MSEYKRRYKKRLWKNKREAILKADSYLCKECIRYGRSTEAVVVHHIYPSDLYPELFNVDANLLSLCWKCHELMHDRTTREITNLGRQWQRRRERRIFK